ncbi:MAG: hypothetical protein U0457_04290 [Candidatus Sericytochromatia bacterium]
MHNHVHIHYHPSAKNIDKDKVVSDLESLKAFNGFDDFMYYSYKHWLFLVQENLIEEVKTAFDKICTKYNKFKNNDKKQEEIELFIVHMNRVLEYINKHLIHEATEEVESFIANYVNIPDKFVRNFNKRVG